MAREHLRLDGLTIDVTNGPPTEYHLFRYGLIDTTQGTFLFDPEAAASVMAEYQRNGRQLSFDYNHQLPRAITGDTSDGDAPAAGWFDLDVRQDGLWLINIAWTPRAVERLTNREYRYVSPFLLFDNATGRILELINVALTNVPATRNMLPLVADGLTTNTITTTGTGTGTGEQFSPTLTITRDMTDAPVTVTAAVWMQPKEPASNRKDTKKMQTLLDTLGVPEAKEADAVAAANTLIADRKALLDATGSDTVTEAVSVIKELHEIREASKELSKALAEAEAAAENARLDALIGEGARSGKLPPKLHEWARSIGSTQLAAYLDAAPEAVPTKSRQSPAPDNRERVTLNEAIASVRKDASARGDTITHVDAIVEARARYPHLRGEGSN